MTNWIRECSLWMVVLVGQFFASPTTSNGQSGGYLRVASSPPGASIAIDGATFGVTGADFESSPVISSTVGTHDLRVSLPGVGEDQFSITLFPSDTLEIFVELGSTEQLLNLRSSPSGADVTINGVEMGQTPLEGLTIMGGDYQISLNHGCYRPYDAEVSMAGKPQLDLQLDLEQTIFVTEPYPDEVLGISLCQTDRLIEVRYSLIPGPTGDPNAKWQVDAFLRNAGNHLSAKMNGDINKTMSIGPKAFEVELPADVNLDERFELNLTTVAKTEGSSSKMPFIIGAAVIIAGGVAAAVLLGGGDGDSGGGPPGTQAPLPPGRPQ